MNVFFILMSDWLGKYDGVFERAHSALCQFKVLICSRKTNNRSIKNLPSGASLASSACCFARTLIILGFNCVPDYMFFICCLWYLNSRKSSIIRNRFLTNSLIILSSELTKSKSTGSLMHPNFNWLVDCFGGVIGGMGTGILCRRAFRMTEG